MSGPAAAAARTWDAWLAAQPLDDLAAWHADTRALVAGYGRRDDAHLVPLRLPIVDHDRYEELATVSSRLVALTATALQMHGDPEALFAEMGLPDVVRRSFGSHATAFDLARAFARVDLVVSGGAPYVLELNVDSGIGGLVEGCLLPEHYLDGPGRPAGLYADAPLAAVADLLTALAAEAGLGPRPTVAVLEWDYDVALQHAYAARLARYGLPAAYVHADTLEERDGVLWTGDRRIDIALKNFSMGSLDFPDRLEPLVAARTQGRSLVVADARSVLASNKRLLAILSERATELAPADRALVERYVPWTREVTPALAGVLARREGLVLKRASGEGGHHVVIGARCTTEQWEAAVAEAFTGPDFIVQAYKPADREALPFLDGDRVVQRAHPYVLGQFVIDGRGAGLLYRFDPHDQDGVINYMRGAGLVTALVAR